MDKIKVPLMSGGSLEVKFPTDEQWKARQKQRRIIVRSLGRGQSQTEVSGGEDFDLALLGEISGGADGVDAAEAALILNQLQWTNVDDVVRQDGGFLVTLRSSWGSIVEYLLVGLTAKQVAAYRRASVTLIDLPHGQQQIKTNMQPAADLFDALCPAHKGIPIVHKVPVVSAVVGELDALMEPSAEGFQKGS